jgi:hypothetical protein
LRVSEKENSNSIGISRSNAKKSGFATNSLEALLLLDVFLLILQVPLVRVLLDPRFQCQVNALNQS